MPSFKSTIFAVAAAFVASAHADYVINPKSVPLATRKSWCQDETNTCPIICQQVEPRTTLVNTCNSETLEYGCICGDGKQPNMTEYSLTLPYHVCQEYGNQCVTNCGLGANQCASKCREDHPCGASNPTRENKTSSTGTATATASSTQTSGAIFTGMAGDDSSNGSGSSGAAALAMGREAGFAVLVGSLLGGVALLLMGTKTSDRAAAAECISDDALIHLKSYKYSAVDKSPISNYILRPYWNAAVELLPLWLAPNMVTLLGFFFILGNIGLLVVFMPDLVGPGPSWLYYSFAFGLFMYQTMDNLDGKQARRTGTSSGLGELFDHGIDSLNCTLASLLETAAMGLGCSKSGVFTALVPCLPMFFSTWETYHTHTLYLGRINGPTEGILIACSVMVVSGIYGPGIWTQPIINLLGEGHEQYTFGFAHLMGDTSIRDIWIGMIVFSLFATHVPFCVLHVIKARRARGEPVAPVFLEWTPMAVYTLAIGAWIYSPYTSLRSENHLVLFCLTMSFVFGRLTTKMILAHLTKQPFPYWTVMLVPLVGGACLANLPVIGISAISAQTELYYLYGYFIFSAVVYFRWAYLVITSICNFLGINALTIPKEKQLANKQALEAAKTGPILNGTANGFKKE
ncbi:CDP-alcohol phosphatidyltransferase [Colletotrichum karsti]|uniref:CDP-alcohol phosphatidyltransferase n=1 Tax=Colletotrichum karsti TaxID=1095194 RepID=A0A9P6I4K3_9PEZI|nr:CDP-alcohol phosphatidyltransferase [Colletotrichum karsti]KAF9875720.1 CDP-alcohol phosphatidyltransferase [Colletotrichum karsti]